MQEAKALQLQAFRSIQCVYCEKPFAPSGSGTCTPVANQSSLLIDYSQSFYLGWKAGTFDLFAVADTELDPQLANCAAMQPRKANDELVNRAASPGLFAFDESQCVAAKTSGSISKHANHTLSWFAVTAASLLLVSLLP
jgi:hypothetical protein